MQPLIEHILQRVDCLGTSWRKEPSSNHPMILREFNAANASAQTHVELCEGIQRPSPEGLSGAMIAIRRGW